MEAPKAAPVSQPLVPPKSPAAAEKTVRSLTRSLSSLLPHVKSNLSVLYRLSSVCTCWSSELLREP